MISTKKVQEIMRNHNLRTPAEFESFAQSFPTQVAAEAGLTVEQVRELYGTPPAVPSRHFGAMPPAR